ncbi:MAG: hypothetical protein AB1757_12330 [Acidobacteriota bacterium]
MFCPNCGKAEQQAESFCRQCGTFLPDFDKISSRQISPEQHFTANITLNAMTAVVSLALAITLYVIFLGKAETPVVIYLTAGFLTAIFFWQVQIFWRTLLLKKQFPGLNKKSANPAQNSASVKTRELLKEPDASVTMPPSVTEKTTARLGEKIPPKSSQSEHSSP